MGSGESKYSQPPVSADSANHGLKIFGEKNPEISKEQNLNFPCASNYLHNIYIVLSIISNLEMI